jgi:hypothetical protein
VGTGGLGVGGRAGACTHHLRIAYFIAHTLITSIALFPFNPRLGDHGWCVPALLCSLQANPGATATSIAQAAAAGGSSSSAVASAIASGGACLLLCPAYPLTLDMLALQLAIA